jgi:hypothetical protein
MASASTPPIAAKIPTSGWAGYSASPIKGYVIDEEANWNVPAIKCPSSPVDHPRADVWVGMWGSLPSMAKRIGKHTHTPDAWVPQIGTDSRCDGLGLASYSLTWEMYSQVTGGGNGQQYGLDCPGDATYSLCGNLTSISPGDVVNAAVYFEGPYTAKPAQRKFEIRLTDLTTGDYVTGNMRTNKPVPIGDIAAQGGVIVENEPPCGLVDLLLLRCLASTVGENGLAHFADPVTIGTVYTSGNATTDLRYYRWEMILNGHALAQDSPLAVVDDTMNFNVEWLRQN